MSLSSVGFARGNNGSTRSHLLLHYVYFAKVVKIYVDRNQTPTKLPKDVEEVT